MAVFITGTVSFWGVPVFVGPMSEDTGWSHASILGALSVRFLVGAIGGLALGHIADRRGGPSRLLFAGVLVDAASLVALLWVENALQFVLVYGVIGGVGNTGTRLVQSTLVAKWFVARRGTAVGFSSNGGGVSALIMVPVIALLISEFGWREAWVALAGIMVVLLLPLVPLAVRAPEDMGLLPDNGVIPTSVRRRASALTERSFKLSEVVGTWQFWLLLTGVLVGNYSLQTHTVIMVPHFEDIGFSSAAAASALSVYGLCSLTMRFIWGVVADRLSVRTAIMMQSALTGLGAYLLLEIGGRTSLYLVVAYQGLMLSGFPPLQILLWPEFFGRMHIGSIVGLTQFFSTFAGAVGPLVAGYAFDQTGSYNSAIWMLVVTWVVTVLIMYAARPVRETDAPQPAPT
jgi:MFS family permease